MAQVLAVHLSKVMGWTPEPSDVMSDYGVNGDVANGGFLVDRECIHTAIDLPGNKLTCHVDRRQHLRHRPGAETRPRHSDARR